jgi:hypothetical protein
MNEQHPGAENNNSSITSAISLIKPHLLSIIFRTNISTRKLRKIKTPIMRIYAHTDTNGAAKNELCLKFENFT